VCDQGEAYDGANDQETYVHPLKAVRRHSYGTSTERLQDKTEPYRPHAYGALFLRLRHAAHTRQGTTLRGIDPDVVQVYLIDDT
jgi:hypothetical protein